MSASGTTQPKDTQTMTLDLSEFERLWIIGLLIVWALLLFGGMALGNLNADETHRMPTWTRMASSVALVIAGWSWYSFSRESDLEHLALFLGLGMTFGLLGDLLMAGVIPFPDRVLGGIGAFGIGHVVYIIGLFNYGNTYDLADPSRRWGSLAVWLILGAILWFFVVYQGAEERSVLHLAALPYALLLASTAAFATGLALQNSAFTLVAIGATLFLLSDLLLAAQLFNGLHFQYIGDVVWLMYGPGQMLIVYGIVLHVLRSG